MADDSAPLTSEQRAFLTKYLGVSLPDGGTAAEMGKAPAAVPIWMEAREDVGNQISALQSHLKTRPEPLFQKIADAGLHGVTSGQLSKLQAALMDFDGASGAAKQDAAELAQTASEAMRTFLKDNLVLPLLERNPFNVTVTIRATLGAALDRIDRILMGA